MRRDLEGRPALRSSDLRTARPWRALRSPLTLLFRGPLRHRHRGGTDAAVDHSSRRLSDLPTERPAAGPRDPKGNVVRHPCRQRRDSTMDDPVRPTVPAPDRAPREIADHSPRGARSSRLKTTCGGRPLGPERPKVRAPAPLTEALTACKSLSYHFCAIIKKDRWRTYGWCPQAYPISFAASFRGLKA